MYSWVTREIVTWPHELFLKAADSVIPRSPHLESFVPPSPLLVMAPKLSKVCPSRWPDEGTDDDSDFADDHQPDVSTDEDSIMSGDEQVIAEGRAVNSNDKDNPGDEDAAAVGDEEAAAVGDEDAINEEKDSSVEEKYGAHS